MGRPPAERLDSCRERQAYDSLRASRIRSSSEARILNFQDGTPVVLSKYDRGCVEMQAS